MTENLEYKISLSDLFSSGIQRAEGHASSFDHHVIAIREHISSLTERAIQAFGIFEAFEFGKSSAEKFIEAQKAAAQLQFTVGKRGGLASDFSDLTEQSEKLGKTSFFNHVEIQQAANQLLNYGISVKATKASLTALTDVGVAKGKSLSEVISAAGMAAAGGRAMALKEYGLGFLKLEKDMSVAGAEARNFRKIIAAMGKEFAGATDQMSGKEFFKIKKIQDELEDFKEKVGNQLLKAFDMMLPYFRKAIEYATEFGHFIKENSGAIKVLGSVIIGAASAMALYNSAVFVAKAYTASLALIEGVQLVSALTGATVGQLALNAAMTAAMKINPFAAAIVGAGLLLALTMKLKNANDEWRESVLNESQKRYEHRFDSIKEEISKVNELASTYKGLARDKAIDKALDVEEAEMTKKLLSLKRDSKEFTAEKSKLDAFLLARGEKKSLFETAKKTPSDNEGLGSGLSEPKASSIKNITINLGGVQIDEKVYPQIAEQGVGSFANKFIQVLNSIVQDAAIVASE